MLICMKKLVTNNNMIPNDLLSSTELFESADVDAATTMDEHVEEKGKQNHKNRKKQSELWEPGDPLEETGFEKNSKLTGNTPGASLRTHQRDIPPRDSILDD